MFRRFDVELVVRPEHGRQIDRDEDSVKYTIDAETASEARRAAFEAARSQGLWISQVLKFDEVSAQ